MITQLSILIPVYNDVAAPLVAALRRQAEAIRGLEYEIVVFDDGSTDASAIKQNEAACALPRCRYVRAGRHASRSAMRNDMARQGRYDWRLMVDARVSPVRGDFIRRYLESGAHEGEAVIGGVTVDGGAAAGRLYRENLRFRYEKREGEKHSPEARRKRPCAALRTTNFFHHRTVLERVPYDERVITYGYEDVLLGKALQEADGQAVDIADFRYDGRRPQSKESAIIMLADTVEAAVRSMHDPTPQKIREFISKLVRGKLDDGQLDNAPLTLRDITRICDAFSTVLNGVFHERIEYPAISPAAAAHVAAQARLTASPTTSRMANTDSSNWTVPD